MTVMSEYYRGRVAVVTGGASGVGLALADSLLVYGAGRVVLADISDANLERQTARLNAAASGKVLGIRCDITRGGGCAGHDSAGRSVRRREG